MTKKSTARSILTIIPFALMAVISTISLIFAISNLIDNRQAARLKPVISGCDAYLLMPSVAIKDCTTLIKSPRIPRYFKMIAYIQRGQAHYIVGNHKLAIMDIDTYLKDNRDSHWGYSLRALSYYKLENYQLALESNKRSITIYNKNYAYFELKGKILEKMNDRKRSIDAYKRAVSLNPDAAKPSKIAIARLTKIEKRQ